MWSLLAHTVKGGAGAASYTTTGIDTTGADLILVIVAYFFGASVSLSDSNGNSWSPRTAYSGNSTTVIQILYSQAPVVGAGHTFTPNISGGFSSCSVLAFSGSKASPFDVENGHGGAGGTSQQPGSITPTVTNDLLILAAAFGSGISASAPTADSGFSSAVDFHQGASGVDFGIADFWLADSAASAVNPTVSWSGAADNAVTIAAFKAAPVVPTPQLMGQNLY